MGKNFLGWYVTLDKLQQTVHYKTCYNFVHLAEINTLNGIS